MYTPQPLKRGAWKKIVCFTLDFCVACFSRFCSTLVTDWKDSSPK